MFLLGDVFLRNFYSVYDFLDLSVYLAVNEHSKDSVGFNQGLSKFSNIIVFTIIMAIFVGGSYFIIKFHT